MTTSVIMTSYSELICELEVTYTPSTWWERKIMRLPVRTEKWKSLNGNSAYLREDGEMLNMFDPERYDLYQKLHQASLAGMLKRLSEIRESLSETLKPIHP